MIGCTNKMHDHALEDNDDPGFCNDCKARTHFDEATGWYHHDNPALELCHLVNDHSPPHSPCEMVCAGCGTKITQGTGGYWYDNPTTGSFMCDDLGVHDPLGIGVDNESLYARRTD